MKPQKLIVSIPEPCGEDWNKMSPRQEGRFCSSCSKTVIDFTGMSEEQITSLLLEKRDQKVCGHFKKEQLDRPLLIRVNLHELPANMSLTKTFAIATFLVFGSLLFSCTTPEGQTVGKIEIQTEPKNNKPIEVLSGDSIFVGGNLAYDPDLEILYETGMSGDVSVQEEAPIKKRGDDTSIFYSKGKPQLKRGEVVVDAEEQKTEECAKEPEYKKFTHKINSPTMGGVLIEPVEPIDSILEITVNIEKIISYSGGISYQLVDEEERLDENSDGQSAETKNENLIPYSEFKVFPNPNRGEFVVSYELKDKKDVQIDVFSETGVLVQSLVNQSKQYPAKYQLPVNLSNLSSGVYIVRLQSGEAILNRKVILQSN